MTTARARYRKLRRVLLAIAVAEAAEEPRSPHVEQPHEGEGRGRDHLGESVIAEVGRQMGGDEGDVEAADEEAGVEQEVTRMPAGAGQLAGEAVLEVGGAGTLGGLRCPREPEGEGGDGRHHGGAVQQCRLPGDGLDQPLDQRHDSEGAEGAGGGDDAEGGGPLLRGHDAGHGAEKDDVRGGAESQADQGSEGEEGEPGSAGHGEEGEAGGVEQGTPGHHPARADAVGEDPGNRQSEEDVLQGHGEAEGLAARGQRFRHRLQEQAEGLPRAHGDGDDDRADQDDEGGLLQDGVRPELRRGGSDAQPGTGG